MEKWNVNGQGTKESDTADRKLSDDGQWLWLTWQSRSLPIPEVRGSKPVIVNIYIEHLLTVNCIKMTKIEKKRQGMAHFLKKLSDDILFKIQFLRGARRWLGNSAIVVWVVAME